MGLLQIVSEEDSLALVCVERKLAAATAAAARLSLMLNSLTKCQICLSIIQCLINLHPFCFQHIIIHLYAVLCRTNKRAFDI